MANIAVEPIVIYTNKSLPNIAYHVKRLRDKSKGYGKIFEESYPNLNAFATISNSLVLTLELLDYYYDNWWKKQHKERLNKFEIERVTTICKWAFIHSFSIIEYISKELLKRTTFKGFENIHSRLKEGEIVYFSTIIKKSKENGLLSKNEKKIWNNLKDIRNMIIHNNAYSDKDGILEYTIEGTGQFKLIYERDKPLTYNMNLGTILIEIMIEQYYQWIKKILNAKLNY